MSKASPLQYNGNKIPGIKTTVNHKLYLHLNSVSPIARWMKRLELVVLLSFQ